MKMNCEVSFLVHYVNENIKKEKKNEQLKIQTNRRDGKKPFKLSNNFKSNSIWKWFIGSTTNKLFHHKAYK